MSNYILGLDLGTNSIGWAAVGCDELIKPTHLIDANSRIFQAMIEADTKVPKNKNRREKRSARTQITHFKLRRASLLELLIKHHFIPVDFKQTSDWGAILSQHGKLPEGQLKTFLSFNPLHMRVEALSLDLSLHEMGRLLMHLLRRRGYKSNRGIKYWSLFRYLKEQQLLLDCLDAGDKASDNASESYEVDKETGKVLSGISILKNAMQHDETIAQFLVRKAHDEAWNMPRRLHSIQMDETKILSRGKSKGQEKTTTYDLHANRELYEWEFYKIWDKQSANLCKLLSKTAHETETLGQDIYHSIFDQRPLQLQKSKVGVCSINPKKKRASAALLESQEYLLLQDINNLKYSEVQTVRRHQEFNEQTKMSLGSEQRQLLIDALSNPAYMDDKDKISWDKVREIIRIDSRYKFNLEVSKNKESSGEYIKSSKAGIKGNITALAISRVIPQQWQNLSDVNKKVLVNDLLNIHDKAALFNRLRNHHKLDRCPWSFTDREAFELATLELPTGYMGHCFDVINKLNIHLEKGKKQPEAVAIAEFSNNLSNKDLKFLDMPPNVANPIVQKALFELRRVFNAIVEKLGEKPKLIRIEMGRDMKASKAHRTEMEKRNRENQSINERVAKEIREWNKKNPQLKLDEKRDLIKVKLMLEQNNQCLYSDTVGRTSITMVNIANGDVDIDHIYTLSLSGMDDYLNKVLVFRTENLAKSQKTPWQAWGNTEKYNQILDRANKWYGAADSPLKSKLAKIKDQSNEQEFREKMAEFTRAQLNDTRYICVAVRNYLKTVGYTDQEIQVSRGRATSEIRHLWGLSNILPKSKDDKPDSLEAPDVGIDTTDEKTKKANKKDRGDHRHHAIDAIVIALTDLSTYKELQKRYRYYEERGAWPKVPLALPWLTLQQDTEKMVLNRVVSFSSNRKVSGALHDEMPYGLGFHEEKMALKKLLKSLDIIRAMPDKGSGKTLNDSDVWIVNTGMRELIQAWLLAYEKTSCAKDFPLPMLRDGTEPQNITIARRCYLKRISVVEALKRIDNDPGKRTWIYNQELRKHLRVWLNQSSNTVKSAEHTPPLMPSKSGVGNPIKTVRMASLSNAMVKFGNKPQVFAKSSNHHVAIFKRVVNNQVIERKGIFVDLLEAAKRVRTPPVVRKLPEQLLALDSKINLAEWQYEMFLCNNDMVLWDVEDPDWRDSNIENLDVKNQHLPIYRLQKMTEGQLTFRHFSVTSSADTDSRGVIRRSPTKLRCKKIRMDVLGNYTICDD